MKIVHEATAVRKGASAHRGGGVHFLSLLQGEENTPNNFHLTLVYANDYVAPRHRHNFDQVRIVLEGAFGFDREMTQEAGMLGYFTEGTYYTQKSVGQSTTLLLQSGGASGTGLTSPMQGTVVKIAVAEGAEVEAGDLIIVLEAMKMEQPLLAHKAGKIANLKAVIGEIVSSGTVLCDILDA